MISIKILFDYRNPVLPLRMFKTHISLSLALAHKIHYDFLSLLVLLKLLLFQSNMELLLCLWKPVKQLEET